MPDILKKKAFRQILLAWLVLISFTAGQAVLFAHRHLPRSATTKIYSRSIVTEKCPLCDALLHHAMLQPESPELGKAIAATIFLPQFACDYSGMLRRHSGGRAPPAAA